MDNILNKGIPIKPPCRIFIDVNTILNNAIDKEQVKSSIEQLGFKNIKYIDTLLEHKSHRYLRFNIGLSISYNEKTKTNEIIMEPIDLLDDICEYLNLGDRYLSTSKDKLFDRCRKLKVIISEKKLKKFFPKLYDIYNKELDERKKTIKNMFNINNGIEDYKKALKKIDDNKRKLDDTLAIDNVSYFCNLYGCMFESILNNFDKIYNHCLNNPIDIFNEYEFSIPNIEADIVSRYLYLIRNSKKIEDKQKLLYYVTAYFKQNKKLINSDISFNINNQNIMFDDLYNIYIDILIDYPELKIFAYDREYFKDFTSQEIEEYMELELKNAKSNWTFIDLENHEERIAKAIYNNTKNIKDKNTRKKTQEELKELFMRKKQLFENSNSYKTVQGQNAFDGYIAYIYPNGKVILERYFERRRDKSEIVATEQAIYVMNIEDFYEISRLSKSTIIKDKLCKRYIHQGNWEEKVKKEINSEGISPVKEYKKLVKERRIVE